MGDPKYPRRDWKKPKRPLNYDLKMEELKTLGTFGLKTKRELWKAHTKLSRLRHQARSLLALREEVRKKKEPLLMNSLARIGLVEENSTLDDVLNLQVTDLLSRRLQTVVHKKLGFKTPYQARQAVTHGHVMIGDRRVSVPSYTVLIKEEKEIHLSSDSSLSKLLEKTQKQDIENAVEQPKVENAVEQPKVENAVEQPKVENAVEQPKVENASQNPEVENSATKPSED
jgi:small subunit ribosomal protein S4